VTFRRFSKRRQRAAIAVALLDQIQWGVPVIIGGATVARQDGICVKCGSKIFTNEEIALASYGPHNAQTFVHIECPDPWDLLADTIEQHDDKIITKINNVGRGRASGCGHNVEGQPVYLVRRPVSLAENHHSDWFCEECVKPQ
jgi:hypothetical protein